MPNGRRVATGDWRRATGDDANREQKLRGASVPCSLFPLFPIPDSRFPTRFWPRCQAMKPAPIGAEHLNRHFIALSEATGDKPLRERSILPPQPQLVPNGETEAPVLAVEVALGETMQVLLGCGGDQVVQRV